MVIFFFLEYLFHWLLNIWENIAKQIGTTGKINVSLTKLSMNEYYIQIEGYFYKQQEVTAMGSIVTFPCKFIHE